MATMTAPTPTAKKIAGGAFLISDASPADCFFPEDFTDEHKQIAQTTAEFATNEILPMGDAIEAKDFRRDAEADQGGVGTGTYFGRYSGGVWRPRDGQGDLGDCGGQYREAGELLGGVFGACGDWDAADHLVRN